MHRRLTRAWQALKEALQSREFWLLLVWTNLVLAAFVWLGWLAVRQFDAFLRLKPLICESGIGNRQFIVIALAGPIGLVFSLAAFGELWLLREAARQGHPGTWRHFLAFALIALACALLVFNALVC
jgi:hypothetical protein